MKIVKCFCTISQIYGAITNVLLIFVGNNAIITAKEKKTFNLRAL